jgi:biopolymer transport protein ExbB
MIGLFGTVYGMIVAFQTIATTGGAADPVLLAGGIGTALVTTFWGLLIAIPATSAYAMIRNRAIATSDEALAEADELIAIFRPRDEAAKG